VARRAGHRVGVLAGAIERPQRGRESRGQRQREHAEHGVQAPSGAPGAPLPSVAGVDQGRDAHLERTDSKGVFSA
jgi:hypothetical protein